MNVRCLQLRAGLNTAHLLCGISAVWIDGWPFTVVG